MQLYTAPKSHLFFVGGRKEEIESLQKLSADLGTKNVLFTGQLAHSKINTFLKAADALILVGNPKSAHQARHASYEKLFEYMAAGRPITASDLPSIHEVLIGNMNALLIKPDSALAISYALKRLASSKWLRKRITFQALIDVKQYTWDLRVEKILRCL